MEKNVAGEPFKPLFLRAENDVNCPIHEQSQSGGIGRRAGFKIQWPQGRVGSSPTSGTLFFKGS